MADLPVPRPHRSRLDPAREDYELIMSLHEAAVRAGQVSYRDPHSGLLVMTVTTLIERGACCESGCRHCPYVTS